MKILYIHGLGSGKYSETPKRLQAALPEAEVIVPEIPINPHEAQRFLGKNFLNDTSIDLVVGSSLGGFYSLLLKHHKKLLANPALFADEDIANGIGLGEQEFLSPRENGATTYMIDDYFIHDLSMIRRKIFRGYPQRLGKPTQEQVNNTWAIFADNDELLHHYDDFCGLFRSDHTCKMKGEHRVSEENMQKDIVPLIRKILNEEGTLKLDKRKWPRSIKGFIARNADLMRKYEIASPEALVSALGDCYNCEKRYVLLNELPAEDRNYLRDYYYRNCNAGRDKEPACLKVVVTYFYKSTWTPKGRDYLVEYKAEFDRIAGTIRCDGKTQRGAEVSIHSVLDEKKVYDLFSCAEASRRKDDKTGYYMDADRTIIHCEYADGFSCDFDPYQIRVFEEYTNELMRSLSHIMENMPFQ